MAVGGVGLGEVGVASDKLKLLVLDRAPSKCLTDFKMSLSLPKVETTRMLGVVGSLSPEVVSVIAFRSSDLSVWSTFFDMLFIMT